jgi:hypothetical protein
LLTDNAYLLAAYSEKSRTLLNQGQEGFADRLIDCFNFLIFVFFDFTFSITLLEVIVIPFLAFHAGHNKEHEVL